MIPDRWQHQLLLALPKKGHKIREPKLRGIGIGPVLNRLYDIILNNRFLAWYKPNREQAGFRENQGCLLQIFILYLLMDYSVINRNNLYIAFLDYEKAFDFVDRCQLIKYMVEKNIDSRYAKAVFNMYGSTVYLPKISIAKIGKEIKTHCGMTQGKSSSANFFSFYVSDMAIETKTKEEKSLVIQLADDTSTIAFSASHLSLRLKNIFEYSKKKSLIVNMEKTDI